MKFALVLMAGILIGFGLGVAVTVRVALQYMEERFAPVRLTRRGF
jgi:hypothetical protein